MPLGMLEFNWRGSICVRVTVTYSFAEQFGTQTSASVYNEKNSFGDQDRFF